jgi:hypothetical protein
MAVERTRENGKEKPPYIGWKTLKKALDKIRERNPAQITKDVLVSWEISGSNATKVLPALRFLRITNTNGSPNEEVWRALNSTDGGYREVLERLVRQAYELVFAEFATMDAMTRENVAASIHRHWKLSPKNEKQAIALFFDLCGEAGIPVPGQKRRRAAREQKPKEPEPDDRVSRRSRRPAAGTTHPGRSIALALTVNVNLTGTEDQSEIVHRLLNVRRALEAAFGETEQPQGD